MPAVDDVENKGVVQLWSDVPEPDSTNGEGDKYIKPGDQGGIKLDRPDIVGQEKNQVVIELQLDLEHPFFGMQDLLLIFLELFRDVPFGIDQGLFALPFGGHLLFMHIRHLEIIAKNIGKSDFQRSDTGPF